MRTSTLRIISISATCALALCCSGTYTPDLKITVDRQICQALAFKEHPEEHETILNKADFVLPVMRGEVKSAAGEWPAQVKLTLEIRSLPSGRQVVLDNIRGDFSFSYPKLEQGDYCYKLMAPGWKSLVGLAKVSVGADRTRFMNLTLPLAV